jgi:hypothetical protein
MNSKNIASDGISGLSNSLQVEEVAMIKEGFKPDFEQESPVMQQRPLRSMKTRRIKKQKGKRVLKRVYFDANDQQSSYSSLMSEYIDCDYSAYLEVNSNAVELEQRYEEERMEERMEARMDERMEEIQENSDEDESPALQNGQNVIEIVDSGGKPRTSESIPADEDVENSENRILKHNSPRENYQVFHQ